MLQEKITQIVQTALADSTELFLIDLKLSPDNSIKVVLDGDQGVSLKDCIRISRSVERTLEQEEVNFSLEVTSAGATSPLIMARQYRKNIGRKLSVTTSEGQIEGNLTAAGEDSITLEWKSREPKPVGKGKVTVQKKKEIPISEIEEAKVVLKF